jgi:hypothetical protein
MKFKNILNSLNYQINKFADLILPNIQKTCTDRFLWGFITDGGFI